MYKRENEVNKSNKISISDMFETAVSEKGRAHPAAAAAEAATNPSPDAGMTSASASASVAERTADVLAPRSFGAAASSAGVISKSPHVSDEHDEEHDEEVRPMLSSASSLEHHSDTAASSATPKKEKQKKRRRSLPRPRWKVVATYVSLATTAVALTVACQDTTLWNYYVPLASGASASSKSEASDTRTRPTASNLEEGAVSAKDKSAKHDKIPKAEEEEHPQSPHKRIDDVTNNNNSAKPSQNPFVSKLLLQPYRVANLDHSLLYQILTAYAIVLLALATVQGSDPGYVTADVVEGLWDEADIAGADDYNEDDEDEQEEMQLLGSSQDDGDADPMSKGGGVDLELGEIRSRRTPGTNTSTNESVVQCQEVGPAPRSNDGSRSNQPWRLPYRPACEHCTAAAEASTSVSSNRSTSQPRLSSISRIFPPHRRPLRTNHCHQCQKCVAAFDHHCNFIGTCIGERNHCRFFCFLVAQCYGFWTLAGVVSSSRIGIRMGLNHILGFTDTAASGAESSVVNVLIVILAKVYLYPLTFFATTILVTHAFFALTNGTTYECAKGSSSKLEYLRGSSMMDCPFGRRGCWANLRLFCCYRDDAASICLRMFPAYLRGGNGNHSFEVARNRKAHPNKGGAWAPIVWSPPGKIDRESADCWQNPYDNKYYSCC